MNFTDKEYLAKGKRGIVYTAMLGKRKIVVKEFNPTADVNTIANEAQMLIAVNKKAIGPLYIGLEQGTLLREFIDGPEIGDWIMRATKPQITSTLINIVEQCRELDVLGINKLEMTHPHKHILMRSNKPVFIDFDRAKYTQKPKNLTQVCQWISSANMQQALAAKKIFIDRKQLLAHAKAYKQSYSKAAYERIIEELQHA